MAGSITLTVDIRKSFAAMLLISASQKMKFGTDEPDITRTGEKRFTVDVAVTTLAEGNMRPVSEVISVGLIGGDLPTIQPGTPVEFDTLREGVSDPEIRQNGKGISGGKRWYQGSGLRPAASSFRSTSKSSETAA